MSNSIAALVTKGLTKSVAYDRQGRLYASDAGLCQRRAVLFSIHTEPSIDTAASAGYYAMGNAIEGLIMDGLFNSKALLFKQYRLPDIGLNLGGYIDGIVLVNGRIRVLEVKSCGKLPDFPKPHHAAQAYIYSAITGIPASLLYFSRTVAKVDGSLLIKEFSMEEDQEEKRKSLFRAVLASMAVRKQVVPDKSPQMTSEAACLEAFCPFTASCWHGAKLQTDWPMASATDNLELVNQAKERTDALLSPASIKDRRTGVLKHLLLHGNARSKEVLEGSDWSTLV